MNQFLQQFGYQIKSYWEAASDEQRDNLTSEILHYANSNPEKFLREIKEIQFDATLIPLPLVLEALSKDTDRWGYFFTDTLDAIFEAAKKTGEPKEILLNLMEFFYIQNDTRPFVQSIVDRLCKEIDSDNLSVKLAAIKMLPVYLNNPAVKKTSLLTDSLQNKLVDRNWKVRYVAFKALGFEGLLPVGHKLSLGDKIRKSVFGDPYFDSRSQQ